ncbi:hypothetical protein HPT25_19865 [Bacillus sp. BRMEA1]|nr:hypothetical protein [Neobacillus endophyticus]NRD79622.1 hypothetical protein [Neobacillus endophyticus]
MGERKKKSPFLTDKPSGTLPKRNKDDSLLLNLNSKMNENIKQLKKNR